MMEAEFAADVSSPRAARRFVVDQLRTAGHDAEILDAASLVISELTTNAVVHARTPFTVTIEHQDFGVRLSVLDSNVSISTVGTVHDLSASSGRGLSLVAAMSSAWGTDSRADGKVVWAELSSP